jgi:hypothetical protein
VHVRKCSTLTCFRITNPMFNGSFSQLWKCMGVSSINWIAWLLNLKIIHQTKSYCHYYKSDYVKTENIFFTKKSSFSNLNMSYSWLITVLLFEELHASIGDLTVVNAILLVTLFYKLCSSKTAFPTVKSPNDTHNFSNTKPIFLKYRNST